MTDQAKAGPTQQTRSPWQAPAVDRFHAGSAETGPGANGETNSLS